MPSAAPIFALLGLGSVLALAAASANAKPSAVPKPGSKGSVILDSQLPEQLQTQVLHTLSTSTDPRELRALATQMLAQGFPLAAAALNAKAAGLEALGASGNFPPAIASSSSPSSASPPTSLGGLDANIDEKTARAVMQLLTGTGTDPAPLVALATSIQGQYPLAAAALMTKATALQAAARAAQAVVPMPSPAPAPVSAAPVPVGSPSASPPYIPVPVPYPVPVPQPTPSGPGTWVLATDADVARDGVAPRFQALLSQPVGTTVTEVHNGRTWQFRVISKTTDPNLTSFAKDVKGWVWAGQGSPAAANLPPVHPAAAASVLQPVPSSRTIASVPPSPAIRTLQHNLNVLGVATPPLVEDGINGPKTIAAVKAFQAAHGLTVDGIAGPNTNGALATALAAKGTGAPLPAPPITPMAFPFPVTPPAALAPALATLRDVQHALNMLGQIPPLVEDNTNGPKTIAAVKAFQAAHGLTVDGIPGPLTKAALIKASQDRVMLTSGARDYAAWRDAP